MQKEISLTEMPFGDGTRAPEQADPLPGATNNRTFQRHLLQGQGAFCYVNDPNLFVLVAVFKCQVVDMPVVLNTSNREAEHQPAAS